MKVILTHSFKYEFDDFGKPIGDPGMTPEGLEVIRGLAPFVSGLFPNSAPSFVASGSGLRHIQIAECLSLPVNLATPLLGGPESLVTVLEEFQVPRGDGTSIKGNVTGPDNPKKKKIVLASGRMVDYGEFRTGVIPETAMNILRELPDNSLVCTGRPVILFGFGMPKDECKSGAVYEVICGETDVSLNLLKDGVVLGDGDGAKV